MDDQKKVSWAVYVKNKTERDGTILASSKDGSAVSLQWHVRSVFDDDFYTVMREMTKTSVDAFTKVEIDFLRVHSDEALQDEHFKSLIPLFKDGVENVDWDAAAEKMRERIAAIFQMDQSALGPETVYIFVFLKDLKTDEQLGSAQFFIQTDYPDGDVRVTSIAVKPEQQRKGLGKLLMDSILKIVPEANRIFLSTRITNEGAIQAYKKWGFSKDPRPQAGHFTFPEHWIHLEYKDKKS